MLNSKLLALSVDAAYNLRADFSGRAKNITGEKAEMLETGIDDFLDIRITPPTGWEVLATSFDSSDSAAYQYKAVAFINKETKEIVLANAGTKPEEVYDIVDDILLAEIKVGGVTLKKASIPYKISSIKAFIDNVQDKLKSDGEDSSQYNFSTTGHSLGGVLSDLCAAELTSRGLKVSESATFENPGSRPIIEAAIKDGVFSSIVDINELTQKVDFNTCNARPNIINSCNNSMGKVDILINKSQSNIKTQENLSSNGWGSYLFNKVGSVVKTVSDTLGLTGPLNLLASAQHHSLVKQIEYDNNPGFKVEREAIAKLNQPTPIKVPTSVLDNLKSAACSGENSKSLSKDYVIIDPRQNEITIPGDDDTWSDLTGSVHYVNHSDLESVS